MASSRRPVIRQNFYHMGILTSLIDRKKLCDDISYSTKLQKNHLLSDKTSSILTDAMHSRRETDIS